MNHKIHQAGASLVVSLIMLLVLTMLVVSAIRSSNVNLRVAGNMQAQAEASAAAQQAIEQVLSTPAIFVTPAPQDIMVGNLNVTVGPPTCIMATPVQFPESADAGGNTIDDSAVASTDPDSSTSGETSSDSGGESSTGSSTGGSTGSTGYLDTYWNVPARVMDQATGASVEHHQGIRIRLPANPNPCL